MLFSASLAATFGLFYLVAAESTQDVLASSSCYITCATYDTQTLATECNVALKCVDCIALRSYYPSAEFNLDFCRSDTQGINACFCTNDGLRNQFSTCLDKTCPDHKDEALDINDTLCKADDKEQSDSVDCLQACVKKLTPQIEAVCTDPKTADDCSCSNQSVRDSLEQCVPATCPDISETALVASGILCSIDGLNLTIPIGSSHNQTVGIPAVNGSQPTPASGKPPAQTGATPNGDRDNSAAALSIGGYAFLVFVAAAALLV